MARTLVARSQVTGRRSRFVRAIAAGGAIALVASSCSSLFGSGEDGSGSGTTGASSSDSLTVQLTNVPHLDPQSVGYGMWLVQMGLLEGLVLQTPDGTEVRPAVAEDWELNEDGTVYTFHLREDAAWSNGDPVTADDFVWTYERLLDPSRGEGGVTTGANSYQTNMGILNAEAFLSGEVTDFGEVGIEAVDAQTLEFTLEIPNPGFLMGLTHPSMLPLHPEHEETWQQPETWMGNGPFNAAAWTLNSSMALERNPEYWDAENVALDGIEVNLVEQGALTTTVPYENGEVDIQSIDDAGDVTRFMDDPELSDELYLVENMQTGYLARMHSENPILEDPQVRSALNLALGREEIAGLAPTTVPASTLISSELPGWSEDLQAHPNMWGDEAVTEAQELLADAGYPNGEGFPEINVLAGADSPQIDAVVDTWETNLGIEVTKDIVEVGVYVERRAELHDEDYVGYYYGSFSGDSTWPYHVEQLWDPALMQEIGLQADEYGEFLEHQAAGDTEAADELRESATNEFVQDYSALVPQVRETTDEAEQQSLYAQAAAAREKAELFIPVTWNSQPLAAKPHVEGFSPRPQADRYYFKDLSISEEG